MAYDDTINIGIDIDVDGAEKLNNVSRDITNLGNTTSTAGNKISGGTSSIRDFINGFSKINKEVNNAARLVNSSLSGFHNTWTKGLRSAVGEIKSLTKEAIDSYNDLTLQHAKTTGAMQNDYDTTTESGKRRFAQDSDALKRQTMDLAKHGTTGDGSLYNATQISEAQTELIKAGIKAPSILNEGVLENILTFAQANDLDMEKAVKFATALGSQFGVKYSDWGDMLDKISHAADLSTIDVSDIVQSMKYAGGITSGLGRSMEEVLAQVVMMGDFGLYGSQSGSSIQSLYSRLLTGDTTVITKAQAEVAPPKALKAFYDFSMFAKSDGSGLTYKQIENADTYEELGEISGNLRPMTEVVDELDKVMSTLNDEEQAWFIKRFFGLYQMKGAYALMNGDDENKSLAEYEREIRDNSTGTNENKLKQILDSDYGKQTTLDNLIDATKTEFGNNLSPLTNKIRDELFKFLNDPNNYEIDYDSIQDAIDECTEAISKQFGDTVGKLFNRITSTFVDLTQVGEELSPELLNGIFGVIDKLLDGDILGAIGEWNKSIGKMRDSVGNLPENLQNLGDKVVSVVDAFGKLMMIDISSRIIELISSALNVVTVLGKMVVNAGSVVVNGKFKNSYTNYNDKKNGKGGNGGTPIPQSTNGKTKDTTKKATKTTTTKKTNTKKTNNTGDAGDVIIHGDDTNAKKKNTKKNTKKTNTKSNKIDDTNTKKKWSDTKAGSGFLNIGNVITGIIGSMFGIKYGAQAGEWITKQFTDDEDAIDNGGKFGMFAGGLLMEELARRGWNKVAPWTLNGVQKVGTSASGFVGGLSASAIAGTTFALSPFALWAMRNNNISYDDARKATVENGGQPFVYEENNILKRLWNIITLQPNRYVMHNEDGSLKTTTNNDWLNNQKELWKTYNNKYAYRENYNEDTYSYITTPRPAGTVWYKPSTWFNGSSNEDVKNWERQQKEWQEKEQQRKSDFYSVQTKLYGDTGVLLKYKDYQSNLSGFQKYASDLKVGNAKSLSDYGIDQKVINKFSVASSQWASVFIDQVNEAIGNQQFGANKDSLANNKKNRSGLTAGIYAYANPMNGVTNNVNNMLANIKGKDNEEDHYLNTIQQSVQNILGKMSNNNVSTDSANADVNGTGIQGQINELAEQSNINTANNQLIAEQLSQTIQVNDQSQLTIMPTTTPVTVQPIITIQAKIDSKGNVEMTQSQQNTLFNMLTQYNVNKSRSYSTGKEG